MLLEMRGLDDEIRALGQALVTGDLDAARVGVQDASASYDLDGTIQDFLWDFGDSTGSKLGLVAQHTYDRPGTFDVTLTVAESVGTVSETKKRFVVVAAAAPGAACDSDEARRFFLDYVQLHGELYWQHAAEREGPPPTPSPGSRRPRSQPDRSWAMRTAASAAAARRDVARATAEADSAADCAPVA